PRDRRRLFSPQDGVHPLPLLCDVPVQNLLNKGILAREVMVERALGDTRGLQDFRQARTGIPLLPNQAPTRLDQCVLELPYLIPERIDRSSSGINCQFRSPPSALSSRIPRAAPSSFIPLAA